MKKHTKEVIHKDNKCRTCEAACCKYVVIEIDAPTCKKDYEEMRWIIAHKDVYLECVRKEWYVCFRTKCRFLNKHHVCKIYSTRPKTCRDHATGSCDMTGFEEKVTHRFMNLKEFDEWLVKKTVNKSTSQYVNKSTS